MPQVQATDNVKIGPAARRARKRVPLPVGFLPLLRDGDLLFNALALQRQIVGGTTVDQAIVDVRGYMSRQRNVMGVDPIQAGRRIFGSVRDGASILLRHTLAGVYSRGMAPSVAAEWLQQVGSVRGRAMCRTLGQRVWEENTVCSEYLRSCPTCVGIETSNQGFAAWKVLHQMPSVERCVYHGTVLVHELAPPHRERKNPPLWPLRLPTGSASLQVEAPLPVTEGYAAYLKLWVSLFGGDLPAVRADRWRMLIGAEIKRSGDVAQLQSALERQIEHSWAAPLAKVAQHLCLSGGENFVAEELRLKTQPKDIARRLILYAAALQIGLFASHENQMELQLAADCPTKSDPEKAAEITLRNAVAARGLPVALEEILLGDGAAVRAAKAIGVTRGNFRAFVRSLPTPLLRALAEERALDDESWVRRELRNRAVRSRSG